MSRRALHLIACVLVLGLAPVATGQQGKPRMAIKAFDNPSVSRNSTIGDAVADILFTELGRTGQFQLVERDAFDQIAQEIDFGSSGWVEAGSASEAGGLLGAEFILMGTVSNFSYDEEAFRDRVRTSRGVVDVTRYRQNAAVRVDFRVVSTSTGVAVLTESGTATQSNVSDTAELATFRSLIRSGSFTGEALNSLIGRTTVDAVQDMVRKVSDLSRELSAYSTRAAVSSATASLDELVGQVTGIVGGAVFTDLGADHGLQLGDQLEVFVEDVTRNDAGEVLFRDERTLAVLEVTAVNPDATRTELVSTPESATRQPREGDDVRVDTAHAALMRGGPASATAVPARAGGDTLAESEAGRLVRRAERYLEDRYYAQAVAYYQ